MTNIIYSTQTHYIILAPGPLPGRRRLHPHAEESPAGAAGRRRKKQVRQTQYNGDILSVKTVHKQNPTNTFSTVLLQLAPPAGDGPARKKQRNLDNRHKRT